MRARLPDGYRAMALAAALMSARVALLGASGPMPIGDRELIIYDELILT